MPDGARFFLNDETYREELRKPFDAPQVEYLPKAGIRLAYVSHGNVTDRLNHVAPDWTYHIDHVETVNGHVTGVLGTMTVGGKSIQEAGDVGGSPSNWGEELQKAISNFVRRGAMRFGVGLDLWIKGDAAEFQAAGRSQLPSGTSSPSPEHSGAAVPADASRADGAVASGAAGSSRRVTTAASEHSGEPKEPLANGEGTSGSKAPDSPGSEAVSAASEPGLQSSGAGQATVQEPSPSTPAPAPDPLAVPIGTFRGKTFVEWAQKSPGTLRSVLRTKNDLTDAQVAEAVTALERVGA